jgi:uncharacterized membrane protein
MLESEEIYRRAFNHYGMKEDEVKILVLQGTDYAQYSTDEEKLNAFWDDLLQSNRAGLEDTVEDEKSLPEDDRKLDDNDVRRLDELKKEKTQKRKAEIVEDEAAFNEAGAHLPSEERTNYRDVLRDIRNLKIEDDETE